MGNPVVRLTDLYKDAGLCKRYNVKLPIMKPTHCRGCGKVFPSVYLLVNHCELMHCFSCELCKTDIKNQPDLDDHMQKCHFNDNKKCTFCDRQFSNMGEYTRHMIGQHGLIQNFKPNTQHAYLLRQPEQSVTLPVIKGVKKFDLKRNISIGPNAILSSKFESQYNNEPHMFQNVSCCCQICKPTVSNVHKVLKKSSKLVQKSSPLPLNIGPTLGLGLNKKSIPNHTIPCREITSINAIETTTNTFTKTQNYPMKKIAYGERISDLSPQGMVLIPISEVCDFIKPQANLKIASVNSLAPNGFRDISKYSSKLIDLDNQDCEIAYDTNNNSSPRPKLSILTENFTGGPQPMKNKQKNPKLLNTSIYQVFDV